MIFGSKGKASHDQEAAKIMNVDRRAFINLLKSDCKTTLVKSSGLDSKIIHQVNTGTPCEDGMHQTLFTRRASDDKASMRKN